MSRIVVLMGAPGAGKGTQARLLSAKFAYPQISTGDILRAMARAKTPLGREINAAQGAGHLVSDTVLANVILARTAQSDCCDGYILDGYPRTLRQAHALERLADHGTREILAVAVNVPPDTLLKRLTGRRTCTRCGEIYNLHLSPPTSEGRCNLDGAPLAHRTDDTADTVSKRLVAYAEATTPLLEYYRESGRLVEVDGGSSTGDVFRKICVAMAGRKAKRAGTRPAWGTRPGRARGELRREASER